MGCRPPHLRFPELCDDSARQHPTSADPMGLQPGVTLLPLSCSELSLQAQALRSSWGGDCALMPLPGRGTPHRVQNLKVNKGRNSGARI